MNILYTNFHVSPNIGGHTAYISRLVCGLKAKHKVFLAVPGSSALFRTFQNSSDVQVFDQSFPNKLAQMPAALKMLKRVISEQNFDIIHVNGSADHRLVMLALLGQKKRPSIVFTKHNDHPVHSFGSKLRAKFGTDHTIAVCDFVGTILAQSPYADVGVTTIFNGIDTNHFSSVVGNNIESIREKLFGPENSKKIILGSNAGTASYKGWIDLVHALTHLDPSQADCFHIAIAGATPSKILVDKVHELGMDKHFTYVGSLVDVRPFLNAIDIGFVLSHRVETISFACREMMAMRKPVIVTNHAGLPENIDHGVDGWVVERQNPEKIAQLLKAILDGRFDLSCMSKAARIKSENSFGDEKFISMTEDVYRNLLK